MGNKERDGEEIGKGWGMDGEEIEKERRGKSYEMRGMEGNGGM